MAATDYSFFSRLFHGLTLGNRFAAEMSLDLDKTLFPAGERDVAAEPHVFVAGLARAGTTVLMRELYATGHYRSLTYRDMPLVLAPNLWERVSRGSRIEETETERAHGDGILVGFDSPEALEEAFWRVFSGDDYIRPDRLVPMRGGRDVVDEFRAYVAQILAQHPDRRYLSKNNNNILRLETIARALPGSVALIPFRDPVQHARSLRRQHALFTEQHADDDFSRRYMNWLVHHEFGSDHRPFVFDDADFEALADLDPASDDEYWLTLWSSVYRHLLEAAPGNAVFVSYERLCGETGRVWPALLERIGLPESAPPETLRASTYAVESGDGEAVRAARAIYEALSGKAL